MKWTTPFLLVFSLLPGPFAHAQNPGDKDKPKENPPRQEEPKKQEQQPDRENPPRQEPRNKPEPPEKNKPPRQEEPRNQDQPDRDTNKDKAKNREPNDRQTRDQQAAKSEDDRNRRSENESRHAERRIPDDRFRASFGRGRSFHVRLEGRGATRGRAVQNGGAVQGGPAPRFAYAGYWFELEEPWPVAWGYDDNCYIDYVDDDYYLFDDMHPGMRVFIIVVD